MENKIHLTIKSKKTNNINKICNVNLELEETYRPISQLNTNMAETVLIYIMKKIHSLKINKHLESSSTTTSFTLPE